MAFVAVAHSDQNPVNSLTISKPTGTVDNDIMFAFIKINAQESLTATGWTALPVNSGFDNDTDSAARFYLLYKVASSEGASYDFSWTTAGRAGGTIYTWRDGFNTGAPIETGSNTSYETSNTTCRAAAMTTSGTSRVLLLFAGLHASSSTTLGLPSNPASGITWTEDLAEQVDTGTSRFLRSIYSGTWTGSGSTGDMDVTIGTPLTTKHAFAVALAPAAAGITTEYVAPVDFMTVTSGMIGMRWL